MVCAIIAAAGSGKRMKLEHNKLFMKIGDNTILEHTVLKFISCENIDHVIVVAAPTDKEVIKDHLSKHIDKITLVDGGEQRYHSVYNALKAVPQYCDIVLIHDGARPFVTEETINDCIKGVKQYGNAVVGVPVKDTIKVCNENNIVENTLDRSKLWSIQTPQGFYYKDILLAYETVDFTGTTDDASVIEKAGGKVKIIMGNYHNIKITTPEDKVLASAIFGDKFMNRIGNGFDVHNFIKDRKLVLGGEVIPYEMGLQGHSDADVVTHAIMDALLGGAALGDIGRHFPDNDASFKDICSLKLLADVNDLLKSHQYCIINISAIIMAQAPKLAPYIPLMEKNIAKVLDIDIDQINISATTTEHLGFVGRKEGIAVSAVAMIARI